MQLAPFYSPGEAAELVRIICCEILGQSSIDYYLGKDIILSPMEKERIDNIIQRLKEYEPIQYIQGKARFCQRDFIVEKGVLIPRPETEELVERIIACAHPSAHILDIGTGSGCIAVTLSKGLPEASVTAWDLSEKAVGIARRNNSAMGAAVKVVKQDLFEYRPTGEENYDIIVSNPPYVTEIEKREMEPNVLCWEPHTALFVPDTDPIRYYRRIAEIGREMLTKGGRIFFEINRKYGEEIRIMMTDKGYHEVEIIKDISNNDRIVTGKR